MGWSFGRSIKFGPLRLNLSSRGVGASVGVRGARVAVGPRGTYVSLGSNGFRYRAKLGRSRQRTMHGRGLAPANDATPHMMPAYGQSAGHIATASAAQLAEASSDAVLQDIRAISRRFNWFKAYLVSAIGVVALTTAVTEASFALVTACALVPGYFIAVWNRERRTARLLYDVDDDEILARLAVCNTVGAALSQAAKLWHVYASVNTEDYKRNAGASTLIARTPTLSRPGSLAHLELNIEPWCLPVGPQRLLFLPDRLLIQEKGSFAAIAYGELSSSHEVIRFIEEEAVPDDSRQVDATWRFVNKSGGPDRRFNENRQLPILEYGRLTLCSPAGLTIIIQSSNPEATRAAAEALGQLREMSQLPRTASTQTSQMLREQTPLAPPTELSQSSLESGCVLLRYIAAADRKLADSEVERALCALSELSSNRELIGDLATGFRGMRVDEERAHQAAAALCRESLSVRTRVMSLCEQMAVADGKNTPKER